MTVTEDSIRKTCSTIDDVADLVEKFSVGKQYFISYGITDKKLTVGYLARNTVRRHSKVKKTRSPWRKLSMNITLSCE